MAKTNTKSTLKTRTVYKDFSCFISNTIIQIKG